MVSHASEPGSVTADSAETMSQLIVDVQCAVEDSESEEPPAGDVLAGWAQSAYRKVGTQPGEVTLRLVGEAEMQGLNRQYRGQDRPTNVLSFAVEIEPGLACEINHLLLGDIVLCHPVVVTEARQQHKSTADHYAHMVTHGILHLCGYDHQDEQNAARMEELETLILAGSGIADPYNPTIGI